MVPRYAGIASFMRLPVAASAEGLDVALFGVPFDGGTTNRPGARHGPRAIREQSSLIRRVHPVTRVAPYDRLRVADVGDATANPFDLADALRGIAAFAADIVAHGALPLAAGGDHLISLPLLRAVARGGPVGLIHFDAHSDTNDRYFGANPYTHGSPFRRAIEEGLLDPARCVQIGIRGSIYGAHDHDYARAQGVRIVTIEEFGERGASDTMRLARERVGEGPAYVSFDIDSLDPSMAPGTGTPEIGGLTTREAQAMLRGLAGVRIVGADVVEVSPPFDVGGMTALAAATVMFELLCAIAQERG